MGSSTLYYLFMFMRFLVLLSGFHLMVTDSSPSVVQQPLCHGSDSSALLEFKQSFLIEKFASGDPSAYPKVEMWQPEREGSDCCSWDGVECDTNNGHVIGLDLSSSCLYGSINSSSSLFRLVHLLRLDLSDNDFNYSKIPHGVGQLSRLTSLNLSSSRFSGQISSQILELSKLVFLDLSSNPLHLHKPNLRNLVVNLTQLKKLHLNEVNISSRVPDVFANLSSLTSLLLENCGLHGEFPTGIFHLSSLQFLSVRNNPDLTGLFPEFHHTSSLKLLALAGTSFSGRLPTSIGNLDSLVELNISSCNFTSGLIPSSLGRLIQLTSLDLSRNSFSGQIPSLSNLKELDTLDLSYNQFIGEIPSWLMNLTRLRRLYLAGNRLEGPIPSSLFGLVNLQCLYLESNYLNGTVDLNILSEMKNLIELQLSNNSLSLLSSININATTLPKFKVLGLNSCNVTVFPDFLQNQDELEVLLLRQNKIHGPIPKWLWNTSKETLAYIDLSHNFLTGFDQNHPVVLPWSRLRILDLSYNMLQGFLPIPPQSTFVYAVSENELSGEIPPSFCNMSSLRLLDFSSNSVSGRIPLCLANFSSSLNALNLGSNNLYGVIPQACTSRNNLMKIDLGGNHLEGQVPTSLGSCLMLEKLDLGNNQINDTFPFWLGALPKLQVLILRSNKFHGEIRGPRTNFGFPKLRIIDISHNGFTGNFPWEYFQSWDAMKILESKHLTYMQVGIKFQVSRHLWTAYYTCSMTMVNKGMERVYEKIPDIFTAADLSSNKFVGEMADCIGKAKGLHLLNLSNNALSGQIPTSLVNLMELEVLDLSQNKLSGEIPQQLVQLTFLEFFNVSHNHLKGPIPRANQFSTFPNSSFDGNLGLCGNPLSRDCGNPEASAPPPSTSEQSSPGELDWIIVLLGYGSGLVIGVLMGYRLTTRKHEWFVRTFGRQKRWRKK